MQSVALSPENIIAIAAVVVGAAIAVAVPISGMVLFFERRMATVETKLDVTHKEFNELKKAIMGML